MDKDTFEAELTASGYNNIESKALEPKPRNTAHAHDYDIYGLVTQGTFIVWLDNQPSTFKAGQICAVPAGKMHAEEVGADGARILVGRK
jgi:quercetin dioxygenase-like cupin family protein